MLLLILVADSGDRDPRSWYMVIDILDPAWYMVIEW